jgi:hypothetical protein
VVVQASAIGRVAAQPQDEQFATRAPRLSV